MCRKYKWVTLQSIYSCSKLLVSNIIAACGIAANSANKCLISLTTFILYCNEWYTYTPDFFCDSEYYTETDKNTV